MSIQPTKTADLWSNFVALVPKERFDALAADNSAAVSEPITDSFEAPARAPAPSFEEAQVMDPKLQMEVAEYIRNSHNSAHANRRMAVDQQIGRYQQINAPNSMAYNNQFNGGYNNQFGMQPGQGGYMSPSYLPNTGYVNNGVPNGPFSPTPFPSATYAPNGNIDPNTGYPYPNNNGGSNIWGNNDWLSRR